MNKEFVPYEESLEIKGLGFDEPCFGRYNVPGEFILSGCYSDSPLICILVEQNDICESHTLAPTFSQAFRWFRKNYEMDSFVRRKYENAVKIGYFFGIDTLKYFEFIDFVSTTYKTYEEAELSCLRKLIEIANEKR